MNTRLLVIEDHHDTSSVVATGLPILTKNQIEVDTVESISAAMIYLAAGLPDVILLDLSLPDSKGIETFDRVREVAQHVPIVVMTGSGEQDIGLKVIERGAEDFIPKATFGFDAMIRSIEYAKKRAECRRETYESIRQARQIVNGELSTGLSRVVDSVKKMDDLLEKSVGTGSRSGKS